MMDDPNTPGSGSAGSAAPKLAVSAMADAHAAMKKINADFIFMPTVYPAYLGVYAGASGYMLGVGPGLPFDVNTSASLSVSPVAPSGASSRGGSLSFWLSSDFATWDRADIGDTVWRGRLFVRAVLALPGRNVTLLDLDVFSLIACSDEVGAEAVTVCIPQEMMRVNSTIDAMADGWDSLSIEVYARSAVNDNYYNSKLVGVWGMSLVLDDMEWVGSSRLNPTAFTTKASPSKFQPHGAPPNASVDNIGRVQAHDNAKYSIAPACDGILFPWADDAGRVYSEDTVNDFTSSICRAVRLAKPKGIAVSV